MMYSKIHGGQKDQNGWKKRQKTLFNNKISIFIVKAFIPNNTLTSSAAGIN